ncbi:hypothetical protein AJ80_01012 [Polytolypa hystricis UAMH7299]|uniref:DUF155 domain-containing protein n=1 Tax=Polytolypa hystricis (strain UAMH7299) TaxID=1447883 RepID=A0A2B7Z2K6_POLH7|nr:hypothetical protein AJ80_01012 [Polytolypa hystricis UAMH7299]
MTSPLGVSGGAGGSGGRKGVDLRLKAAGRLASLPRLPPRSTKVSGKLVLLPETVLEEEEEEEEEDEENVPYMEEGRDILTERARRVPAKQRQRAADFEIDNESAPLLAEEEALRRRRVPAEKAKSYAERLPKARRAEKLARVTAYCTAQAYKMSATTAFIKDYHGARTKLYDDCLYTAYHLPLLPGREGYRIRSSPMLKNAGGKAVLDEEIERNELRDYHEEYPAEEYRAEEEDHSDYAREHHRRTDTESEDTHDDQEHVRQEASRDIHEHNGDSNHKNETDENTPPQQQRSSTTSAPRIAPNVFSFAEMFVFSYGVVVFWNFTERQEIDVLADLAFSSSSKFGAPIPLATNRLPEEDFETEEFHFEYSTEISRPRVYNDMITLRSSDHMIKLAISHGIAQSTKLSFFEEVMARQMAEAKDVPRRLAMTGHLGMKREEVFRFMGKLFKSRVEVNLSSNMLDVPNFFWDSEPTLHPLYIAVREYLEIKPRIQVLNERCRVFLDLIEILSDSIADNKMSRLTWIIIILIFISIIVTISEVILRFAILTRSSSPTDTPNSVISPPVAEL